MRAFLVAYLLCIFGTAHAKLITIDADDFLPGQELSHVEGGAMLSTYFKPSGLAPPQFNPLYAVACGNCSTGAFNGGNVFGVSDSIPGFHDLHRIMGEAPVFSYELFRADFLNPTNYVQIIGGALYASTTPVGVFAFDSNNNHIGTCVAGGRLFSSTPGCDIVLDVPTPGFYSPHYDPWALNISTGSFNISYVLAGGLDAGSRVKSISFVSVPAPSSWALMTIGMFLIAVRRHRRI